MSSELTWKNVNFCLSWVELSWKLGKTTMFVWVELSWIGKLKTKKDAWGRGYAASYKSSCMSCIDHVAEIYSNCFGTVAAGWVKIEICGSCWRKGVLSEQTNLLRPFKLMWKFILGFSLGGGGRLCLGVAAGGIGWVVVLQCWVGWRMRGDRSH